jgi:hypothetical protein
MILLVFTLLTIMLYTTTSKKEYQVKETKLTLIYTLSRLVPMGVLHRQVVPIKEH